MIDRLKELEEKIDRLIDELKTTQKSCTAAEKENASLLDQLKETEQEIAALQKESDQLKHRENLIKAKMEKMVKRLSQLEPILDKMNVQ